MILIVEDDRIIREGLCLSLQSEGYEILSCGTMKEALDLFDTNRNRIGMVLLDVKLPDGDGFEICSRIRACSDVPVLFLTACDDEIHTVLALEQGADDYITKPFHIRELTARMRAIMRRYKGGSASLIRVRDNEVNLASGKVYRDGREVVLSAMEYKLLLILIRHRGSLLERGQILDILYDDLGEYVNDNTLTVYVRRLRNKLGEDTIETVRGIGYRLKED